MFWVLVLKPIHACCFSDPGATTALRLTIPCNLSQCCYIHACTPEPGSVATLWLSILGHWSHYHSGYIWHGVIITLSIPILWLSSTDAPQVSKTLTPLPALEWVKPHLEDQCNCCPKPWVWGPTCKPVSKPLLCGCPWIRHMTSSLWMCQQSRSGTKKKHHSHKFLCRRKRGTQQASATDDFNNGRKRD